MRRTLVLSLALAMLATACGSGKVQDPAQQRRLDQIRDATAVYKSIDAAVTAGYRPVAQCLQSQNGDGAEGLVYANLAQLGTGQVDLLRPQLLFYDPSGPAPTLAGVGYEVPATKKHERPPDTPLGHLDGPIPGLGPGQPTHFELHAWVHKHNPAGPLATWNKDVKCP